MILRDVRQDHSKGPTALLAHSLASGLPPLSAALRTALACANWAGYKCDDGEQSGGNGSASREMWRHPSVLNHL